MSNHRKIVFASLIIGSLFALGAYGVTKANTQGEPSELINKIAERFNLNKDEVKDVFNEHQKEMNSKREEFLEKKLDEAVSTGELTEVQKKLILEKKTALLEQMKKDREEFKNLSSDQRREKMQSQHEEIKKWAEENGIDIKFFMGSGGRSHQEFGPKPSEIRTEVK